MASSSGPGPLRALFLSVVLWPQRLLIFCVSAYRLLLKPWLGNACRFEPTCSAYTLQALHRYGAVRGTALGAWRVLRCQPWCHGGCDPLPETLSNPAAGLFTRLGLRAADPHTTIQKLP